MFRSLAALACIVLGFIAAVADTKILMPAMLWFIAAIAINTLSPVFRGRG